MSHVHAEKVTIFICYSYWELKLKKIDRWHKGKHCMSRWFHLCTGDICISEFQYMDVTLAMGLAIKWFRCESSHLQTDAIPNIISLLCGGWHKGKYCMFRCFHLCKLALCLVIKWFKCESKHWQICAIKHIVSLLHEQKYAVDKDHGLHTYLIFIIWINCLQVSFDIVPSCHREQGSCQPNNKVQTCDKCNENQPKPYEDEEFLIEQVNW